MNLIIFGLGSNIEPRKRYFQTALLMLKAKLGSENFLKYSSIFESSPLTPPNISIEYKNATFLNMCAAFMSDIPPIEILYIIKEIEKVTGRKDSQKWYPREIDIDILIYENNNFASPSLTIPHPRLFERDFSLNPLIELLENLHYEASFFQKQYENLTEKYIIRKYSFNDFK